MRVAALRLPYGRLAAYHWQSARHVRRLDIASFSTSRHLGYSSEEPDVPKTDDDPPKTRVAGRRRLSAAARPKTGIPSPPPIPQWFYKHHVREPAATADPHFMASWTGAQMLRVVKAGTELSIPHFPANTYRREFGTLFLPSPIDADKPGPPAGDGRGQSTLEWTEPKDRHPVTADPRDGKSDNVPKEQTKQPSDLRPTSDPGDAEAARDNNAKHEPGEKAAEHAIPAGRDGELEECAALRSSQELAGNSNDSIREAIAIEIGGRPFQDLDRALFHAHLLLSSLLMATPKQSVPDTRSPRAHLMLTATEPETYYQLPSLVHDLADMAGARLIDLDPSTIAELAGEYIDGPARGPGTVSDLAYDAYEGFTSGDGHDVAVSDEEAEDDIMDLTSPPDPREFLKKAKNILGDVINSIKLIAAPGPVSSKDEDDDNVPDLSRWQGIKLEAFWDNLLTSRTQPQHTDGMLLGSDYSSAQRPTTLAADIATLQASARDVTGQDQSDAQGFDLGMLRRCSRKTTMRLQLAQYLSRLQPSAPEAAPLEGAAPVPPVPDFAGAKTVIHVRDLNIIMETPQGEVIFQRLLKSIEKRKQAGERLVVIGTTAEFIQGEQLEFGDFLRLQVPGLSGEDWQPSRAVPSEKGDAHVEAEDTSASVNTKRHITHVNLRNIQAHARHLDFDLSPRLFSVFERPGLSSIDARLLEEAVLSREQVHEIVLFANAFCKMYTTNTEIALPHVLFAATFLAPRFGAQYAQADMPSEEKAQDEKSPVKPTEPSSAPKPAAPKPRRINMMELQRLCSAHEKRLLPGLREPSKIKTTFGHVHAPASTIDTLKTITGLSLIRPDAFSYGVLAESRLSGLLLYGPPGTGKTMLAKAVAKDAACAVLEVSGAQIYDKYVGEGEKMVRAVFSLAKKLSPCIVFVDEADALFSSRSNDRQRTSHREIITQFLAEWDGMGEHNVFIMVATNRPFELDDAVLRRLPRRVLVDLPTVADRESILRIHLREETLNEDVSLKELAEQTLFFSGSDLRNLCVSAAFAAVKAENALAREHKDDKDFKLPEKRTLTKAHFETAMLEIGASISEDMDSLKAIKKFDEKFGEGRDKRRKKAGDFGFGEGLEQAQTDAAARVRGPT